MLLSDLRAMKWAVCRGGLALDEKWADWADSINLTTLDLNSDSDCIGGQLMGYWDVDGSSDPDEPPEYMDGSFEWFIDEMGVDTDEPTWAIEHGFMVPHTKFVPWNPGVNDEEFWAQRNLEAREAEVLTRFWRRLVIARQEAS